MREWKASNIRYSSWSCPLFRNKTRVSSNNVSAMSHYNWKLVYCSSNFYHSFSTLAAADLACSFQLPKELSFNWKRSLHQTGILILYCPIFYSGLTFFQNCLAVLSLDKADNSSFLRLNHAMIALDIICIDFNINLIKNLNNIFFQFILKDIIRNSL